MSTHERIYDFICETVRREGVIPSFYVIAESLGVSKSTVSYHVGILKREGRLDFSGIPITLRPCVLRFEKAIITNEKGGQ